MRLASLLVGAAIVSLGSAALANSVYERHVVFDNTRGIGWYL